MSKKKKKKNRIYILQAVDKTLNRTYDELMEELQEMQLKLNLADKKLRKKAKKKSKKGSDFFSYEEERKKARKEILDQMEGTNFLDRVNKILGDLAPIVKVIARLVAALILAILSMDVVKISINPEMLAKLNYIYKRAMAIV